MAQDLGWFVSNSLRMGLKCCFVSVVGGCTCSHFAMASRFAERVDVVSQQPERSIVSLRKYRTRLTGKLVRPTFRHLRQRGNPSG
jgi:hypothetical protein